MNKKIVALVLACVLIFSCVVGGTLALLMDKTTTVENTFTFGNVDINLVETPGTGDEGSFKLVPGQTTAKDPTVTVTAGSEDSYVFIKVEEGNDLDTYVEYEIATGWNEYAGEAGVYYREYTSSGSLTEYPILTDNVVTCKSAITNAQIKALTPATLPTLSFTAYAVQKAGMADVDAAWTQAKTATIN